MFVQYAKPNHFAAIRALLRGCALVCDLVTRGIACTILETALAVASGVASPVNAVMVAGDAFKTGGVGGAGGGGGGLGKGGLLITPASFSG